MEQGSNCRQNVGDRACSFRRKSRITNHCQSKTFEESSNNFTYGPGKPATSADVKFLLDLDIDHADWFGFEIQSAKGRTGPNGPRMEGGAVEEVVITV
jgi:hypothetical protein